MTAGRVPTTAALRLLARRCGAELTRRQLRLVAAESCTGGLFAATCTAIAGSSDWFDRGFVSYSNAAKQEMLGVSADTLARHGAVSEQTACEMAAGALVPSRAQVALAITGIAGPSGGSPEKPVGTVCFAWSRKDASPIAQTLQFKGDRESVRRQSVAFALQTLLELLESS